MTYTMSLAFDPAGKSLYTLTVPNSMTKRLSLIISRFDRGDLTLSEEFTPALAADSGLMLAGEKRSLNELYVTGATVADRLYAISAAYAHSSPSTWPPAAWSPLRDSASHAPPASRSGRSHIVGEDGLVSIVEGPARRVLSTCHIRHSRVTPGQAAVEYGRGDAMIRRFCTYRFVIASVVFVLTGLSAAAYFAKRGGVDVTISTLPITRGDVVETVSASGTLEAVTTVQVGAQVSGNIQDLYADFNALVRKGQLLARIDPTMLESQVEQAVATVVKSEAEVERLTVTLANTEVQLARTRKLADKQIAAAMDLDAAEVERRTAQAQLKSAEAQLLQVKGALGQSRVNLEKAAIASPIDGIVISRNVDVGQTVAASMQARRSS
jgi:biotin carboxyl carrier protein